MKICQAGIDLIKSFEGCKLVPYRDSVGVLTVGYGHTGEGVVEGCEISQDKADALLIADLGRFEEGVSKLLTAQVSQAEFSALVCFAYNVGLGNLKSSLLLRCVNMENRPDAAAQFERWDHAGGKVVPGLLRRRQAERDLFLSDPWIKG